MAQYWLLDGCGLIGWLLLRLVMVFSAGMVTLEIGRKTNLNSQFRE